MTEVARVSKEQRFRDLMSDTWVATDALGRALPDFNESGPPREGKYVGIFYFLCHPPGSGPGPYDVSKILAENPENPQWGHGAHYWGEPELGYYLSDDEYVLRRHAHLLSDAGVDTLVFDTTNDLTYPECYMALCRVFEQIRAEGERTPQVCFLASWKSAETLYEEFYSKGLHSDLWFHWKGKPLLLFGQHAGMKREEEFPEEIRNFFTMRSSWAWDNPRWWRDGYHQWPWVAHYPQVFGWDQPGVPEEVAVCVAQHPIYNIGRSYHIGKQPETDKYDLTPFTAEGLCFEEQWRRALEVDPEFIFVTGWNEWIACRWICTEKQEKELREAGNTMVGRPIKAGDGIFIDQYNQEFSRDAEPMKGGHTDNYYYQLASNIRRFKGVRRPLIPSPPVTIGIGGSFSQWDCVHPEYRDHINDTVHRNHAGWGEAGPYVNTTGRNDFVTLKVARDDRFIYFYAETRAPITPHTDPDWMLLFIDADHRQETGWHGYDYRVNASVLDEKITTVQRNTGGCNWESVCRTTYRVEANKLMIAVPRVAIAQDKDRVSFDFHWADNVRTNGDLASFFDCGDNAPNRRFNFRYQEEYYKRIPA